VRVTLKIWAMFPRITMVQFSAAVMLIGSAWIANSASAAAFSQPNAQGGALELTFSSSKTYADPFNEVDVDVVFIQGQQSWRVPTFWDGGSRWTVRFRPPFSGEFQYRLESTDTTNPDLNGHRGRVSIPPYAGNNPLFKHGAPRVSVNHRYLEHADGTPFYWLADTWWSGLSTRLSWDGFQQLTQDRKRKGFTVVQIVAGLVPLEEQAPSDPGFCNEGGCVWNPAFTQINPQFFDYADRRIRYLLDEGITPAIFGAWHSLLAEMGMAKMQKHWRYIIARYGAYPVFWVVGGEIADPPDDLAQGVPAVWQKEFLTRDWTEVARYIKVTDPYHHPLTVHEQVPPVDTPLRDASITDFDLIQSGHAGYPSLAMSVAQLDLRYAQTDRVKPVIQGEIGYENLFNRHFEDFQRAAFWLSMLNGAAGHTYGADGVYEAYTGDRQLHRVRYSFRTWQEGMNLPGSTQVGLGAKLLREYRWWLFQPHPDWISPHGTTLLEPRPIRDGTELGSWLTATKQNYDPTLNFDYPAGEWQARDGTTRLPYAAGIPGEVRFIYIPDGGGPPPAILGLEAGVRYHAFYWQPELGIKFDLGNVERATGIAHVDTSKLDRQLRDAKGESRGTLRGPMWGQFGMHQSIEGDRYHPEKPPTPGDWLLVLETRSATSSRF
jgi:hypothetical protein